MAIVLSGTTNDILVNGVSVATDTEVSSAVAPLASTAYVDGKMVLMTAQNSTSGTSIDFTGIPSWVKKITVMFSGVSSNGASPIQVQIGSSSFITSGYTSYASFIASNSVVSISSTSGFNTQTPTSANTLDGTMLLHNISGNIWVSNHTIGSQGAALVSVGGGKLTSLTGTLDRIRVTTVNGIDTFDAGSINVLYEG